MTDDLDDLKAMMKDATPRPDPARRAANLRLAQENFDALQGSRADGRPTPATGQKGLMTGVFDMLHSLTPKGGLTVTTALVACGLLFLTPAGQDLWQSGQRVLPGPVTEASDEMRARTEATTPRTIEEAPKVEPPAPVAVAPMEMEEAADVGVESFAAEPAPAAPLPRQQAAPSATADAVGGLVVMDRAALPEANTEAFPDADPNPLQITAEDPVSTFSIDVDTASYGVVRKSLMQGSLPPTDAVRVEEMINYFPYDYPAPAAGEAPFRPTVSVMQTPWNPDTQLVHIAIQGTQPAIEDRPPLNLVFLVDTSGSMDDPFKLPLLKQSLMLLLDELTPNDQIAIVAYAGSAGEVLAPTPATERGMILTALARLGAGGGTNGQGGLEQAYATAEAMAEDGEVSRIILATDGDFNVGLSDPTALEDYIADKRESGTYLSVLGFGRGNLDDATMQALAQNGNGTASYIDTLSEARKVLVDQVSGTLFPIADDVKVQVEFNPAQIVEYRLIGYETRALSREDFNNDAVDAGELGAGHSVTALYEVTPVDSPARLSDPLRYSSVEPSRDPSGELGYLKLRYKAPGEEVSQLIETPIPADLSETREAGFAAAIAGFGQLLRDGTYLGDWGYAEAIALARENRGPDPFGYRIEAIGLMELAQSLSQ